MTDEMKPDKVLRLFDRFTEAFRTGDPDPWPVLQEVEGQDRRELEALITEFVDRAGPRPWQGQEAFLASPSRTVANRVADSIVSDDAFDSADAPARPVQDLVTEGAPLPWAKPGWSTLLPSLRIRKQMLRDHVVAELSDRLAAKAAEREKVDFYYHNMEIGNLDPRGVSSTVIDAVASIFGVRSEEIQEAGLKTAPRETSGALFARAGSTAGYEWKRNRPAREVAETSDFDALADLAPAAGMDSPGFEAADRVSGKADPDREPDRIDLLFIDSRSLPSRD